MSKQLNWILLVNPTPEGFELRELIINEGEVAVIQAANVLRPGMTEFVLEAYRSMIRKTEERDAIQAELMIALGTTEHRHEGLNRLQRTRELSRAEELITPDLRGLEECTFMIFLQDPTKTRFHHRSELQDANIQIDVVICSKEASQ
jgi:hypothetical protein